MGRTIESPVELQPLDLALIGELEKDGRLSLTEIGSRLNVSHVTVHNRLDRLLMTDVMRIVPAVDPAKVGFPINVLIMVNADLALMIDIETKLAGFEEVYFAITTSGRYDFAIGAAFESDAKLRAFLAHKLSKVKGVRDTETFHILHTSKRVWDWKVPMRTPGSLRRVMSAAK